MDLRDSTYDQLIATNPDIDQGKIKSKESEGSQIYREYPYRWAILILYLLPNLVNSAMWITLSPIATQIQKVYPDVNSLMVNSATLCFPLLYIFTNFPSIYILDDYGIKLGVLIGTVSTILGLWARCLINNSFYFVIVGQILGGIGQPFILNCPAKIATFWFGNKTRPIITGILSLVNPIGVGIGFIMPAVTVDNDNPTEGEMKNLMFISAIIFTIACLPTLILFKDKPPTPPSLGAQTKKLQFKQSLSKMFVNKNFIIIFIVFCCVIGNFNTLATLMGQYVQAFDFSDADGGIFGVFVVIIGLIGGAVGSILYQNTGKYKLVYTIYTIMSLVTYVLLFAFIDLKSFWLTLFLAGFLGFFTVAVIPLSIEFACEVTFPMGEAMSNGTLVTSGNILNIIQVVIVSALFGETDEDGKMSEKNVLFGCMIGAGLLGVSCIAVFFVQDDLRRLESEKKKKKSLIQSQSQIRQDISMENQQLENQFNQDF